MLHIHSNGGTTTGVSGHAHTFQVNSSAIDSQANSHTHT